MTVTMACSEPTNGAEVAAQRLVALAKDSSGGNGTPGLDHAGSIRLRAPDQQWQLCRVSHCALS